MCSNLLAGYKRDKAPEYGGCRLVLHFVQELGGIHMKISKQAVEAAYQRQAKHYDFAMKLYQLMGLRMQEYRARAVELLHLKRGDRYAMLMVRF